MEGASTVKARAEAPALRIVSLGGGTQSSALALLADNDDRLPTPDAAIYADTGWDPPEVADTVEWLASALSYPVFTVQSRLGRIQDRIGEREDGFVDIPLFGPADDGRISPGRRQCTTKYKILPVLKEIRRQLGVAEGRPVPAGVWVEQWLGISTEEIIRMKPARDAWVENRWPLIELGMSRHDCRRWWDKNAPDDAPPLGSSSCAGCPYHSDDEWLRIADEHPDMLEEIAEIERGVHQSRRPDQWFHRSAVPIGEAVAAIRSRKAREPALFEEHECDGYCGY